MIALALAAALAASSTTNIIILSDIKTENAWKRQVVMQDKDGKFFNDENRIGSTAAVTAADTAATNATKISVSARSAMTNEIRKLEAASVNAATNAVSLALVFEPETSRTNLTMFVVAETTTGTKDTQWVWVNKELYIEPNRFVVYEGYGNCSTQKASWVGWSTTTNITVNGKTWQGCHKCEIFRPTWAYGKPCLTNPNESKFGGVDGFDFGDMVLTMGPVTLATCVLTNRLDATEVIWFSNGAFMGNYIGGEE